MSDKYVIEFTDEEIFVGDKTYRRIKGTNTIMCEDEVELLSEAPQYEPVKENKRTINDIENGETYYYIDSTGKILKAKWDILTEFHNWRRSIGNAFLTEKEAMFYKKRQEVIATLRKYAEPFDAPWDGVRRHYCLTAYSNSHMVAVTFGYTSKIEGFSFATEDDAKKAIAEVGEADLLKYYFMLEE